MMHFKSACVRTKEKEIRNATAEKAGESWNLGCNHNGLKENTRIEHPRRNLTGRHDAGELR